MYENGSLIVECAPTCLEHVFSKGLQVQSLRLDLATHHTLIQYTVDPLSNDGT